MSEGSETKYVTYAIAPGAPTYNEALRAADTIAVVVEQQAERIAELEAQLATARERLGYIDSISRHVRGYHSFEEQMFSLQGIVRKALAAIAPAHDAAIPPRYATPSAWEMISGSWPEHDVLKRLADFAYYQLTERAFDGHGHEELQICVDRAREILRSAQDRKEEEGAALTSAAIRTTHATTNASCEQTKRVPRQCPANKVTNLPEYAKANAKSPDAQVKRPSSATFGFADRAYTRAPMTIMRIGSMAINMPDGTASVVPGGKGGDTH